MKELIRWSELDIKTKIAFVTALVAFIIGWGLTIAGFIVPPVGIVSDSVLWILGQALVYAASVFGVGMYTTGEVKKMKITMNRFMREEKKYLEGEADSMEGEEDA